MIKLSISKSHNLSKRDELILTRILRCTLPEEWGHKYGCMTFIPESSTAVICISPETQLNSLKAVINVNEKHILESIDYTWSDGGKTQHKAWNCTPMAEIFIQSQIHKMEEKEALKQQWDEYLKRPRKKVYIEDLFDEQELLRPNPYREKYKKPQYSSDFRLLGDANNDDYTFTSEAPAVFTAETFKKEFESRYKEAVNATLFGYFDRRKIHIVCISNLPGYTCVEMGKDDHFVVYTDNDTAVDLDSLTIMQQLLITEDIINRL